MIDSDGPFSMYSNCSLNNTNSKLKSIGMLRSISSDDLVLKSSDENTDDDESDVDIVGEPKGYIT